MTKPYYDHKGITIYHGDCRDVLPRLEPVDLVLTDPPYELCDSPPGNSHYGMSLKKFENQAFFDITKGFDFNMIFPLVPMEKFNCFCFCSNKQIAKIMTWSENSGFITTLLIWNKTNAAPFANGVWRGDIEYCVHMRESGATFQGDAELKRKVFQHPSVVDNSHPSVKPMPLIKKYLRIGSTKDSIILDPFMGSGTTLRSAKDLGRKAIGIEIEEKYCEIAAKRLSQEMLPLECCQ